MGLAREPARYQTRHSIGEVLFDAMLPSPSYRGFKFQIL